MSAAPKAPKLAAAQQAATLKAEALEEARQGYASLMAGRVYTDPQQLIGSIDDALTKARAKLTDLDPSKQKTHEQIKTEMMSAAAKIYLANATRLVDRLNYGTGVSGQRYEGIGVEGLDDALFVQKQITKHLADAVKFDSSLGTTAREILGQLPAAVATQELRDAEKILANLTTQSVNDADAAEERFDKIARHLRGYVEHVPEKQKAGAQKLANDLLAEADTVVGRHATVQARKDAGEFERKEFGSAEEVETFAGKIRNRLARAATTDVVFPTTEDKESFESMVATRKASVATRDFHSH